MTGWYILDWLDTPVASDPVSYQNWVKKNPNQKQVGFDQVGEGIRVSTVFLGLDHAWGGGQPVLWETMVFGGYYDGQMERYQYKASAIDGHAATLARVRLGQLGESDASPEDN